MGQKNQLSLFDASAGLDAVTVTEPPKEIPSRKRRIHIQADLDDIAAQKLFQLLKRQLSKYDKNALMKMDVEDLEVAWHDLPFLCLDTETTGLDRNVHRVIEIAWIHFEKQRELDFKTQLLNVDEPLTPEITQLTGITTQMLQGKPAFASIIDNLLTALSKVSFVVAYNAQFDRQFIEAECRRSGRVLPNVPWIDPCIFIRELDRYQKGKKLVDAASRWGVQVQGAHRALADARAAGYLLYKLAPRIQIHGLKDLLKQQHIWQEEQDKNFKAYMARKNGGL